MNGSYLDDFDLDGSQDLTDVVLANAPAPETNPFIFNTEDEPATGTTAPASAPASVGGGVSKEEFETLAGQLRETQDALKAQLEASRRAQYAPQQYQQQYQQPYGQGAPDSAAAKEQLTNQFYQEPVNFIIQTARTMAEQMVSQRTGDVRLGMAENVVHMFKQEKRLNDPTFKVVEKHFERALGEISPQQLAQMGPEQARMALDWAYRASQGDVYAGLAAKQRAKTPAQNPPLYGGGSYGASPSAPAASNDDAESKMAKYLGLSQADFDDVKE